MSSFSDFVATRIVHELYKMCCEKRFRPYEVTKEEPVFRRTLYKYLVIPKESKEPPEPQVLQPETPNHETAPKTNPFAPRPLPRSSSSEDKSSNRKQDKSRDTTENEIKKRSRSGTLPFVQALEGKQKTSNHAQTQPEEHEEKE